MRPAGWDGYLLDLRAAGGFLTVLPLGGREHYRPGGLAGAAWCFPVIGLLVGAAGGLVFGLAIWLGWSNWLAAVLAVASLVLITGALHEDGLGDFADALGGMSRQRRLAIMHDSQAGNFAIVALLLVFAGRIGVIADLASPERVVPALLVAASMSRSAMVLVMHLLPPARTDGLGAGAGRPSRRAAIAAVLLASVIAILALDFGAMLAGWLGAGALAAIIAMLAHRRLGGQTGDVLGAAQLTAEVGCLLAITISF